MCRSTLFPAVLFLAMAPGLSAQQRPLTGQPVSFAPPIVFPSEGPFPTGIASGDFNNDGIPDILVGDLAASAAVSALGNGDGTFGDWVGGCGDGDPASVVAVGKFDGKNLDALTNDIYGGFAAVCLGDGTGHFSGGTLLTVDAANIVNAFASADFNGDGNDDLVLVTGPNANGADPLIAELYVYLSNGDGTFQNPKTRTAMSNAVAVAAGDFNNDGNPDIVVLTADIFDSGGYIAVLLGDGKGVFGSPIRFRLPKNHGNLGFSPPSAIAVGTFNGDKNLDLALGISNYSDQTSYVLILLGNGDGRFRKGQLAPAGWNPLAVAVADLNGDGVPDLAVANPKCPDGSANSCIAILAGNDNGTFQKPQFFSLNSQGAGTLAVADFNGDGRPDVAAPNSVTRTISVLLNTTPWPRAKR